MGTENRNKKEDVPRDEKADKMEDRKEDVPEVEKVDEMEDRKDDEADNEVEDEVGDGYENTGKSAGSTHFNALPVACDRSNT